MNKHIWMVVILVAVLGACSESGQSTGPGNCQSKSNITIDHGPSRITVAPPNFCAEPGQEITVKIVPPQFAEGTARTRAKPGNPDSPDVNNWMNQSNSPDNQAIKLKVPEDIPACAINRIDHSCEYNFAIEIDDFVILDPMITIRQ